jgi:hypothetical protein
VTVPDDFRPPWICWWIADWAGSDRVAQLDTVARLVLAELFWLEGRAGPFKPDAKSIAKRIRLASDEVAESLPQIAAFFDVLPDGRWSNPKAAKERANAYTRSQRAAIGAEGRWKGHQAAPDAKRNAPRNAREDARDHARSDAPDHAVSRLTSHVSQPHNTEPKKEASTPPAPDGARPRRGLVLAAAIALLPAEHEVGLGTAWRGWCEHLWQRKKPTESALRKHLASLAKIVLARGYEPAVKLLDEAVGANAQGLQGWAIEAAMKPPGLNGHAHNGRMSAAEREEARSAAAMDRFAGPDRPRVADLASYLASHPRT